jgi:hypothetical protein
VELDRCRPVGDPQQLGVALDAGAVVPGITLLTGAWSWTRSPARTVTYWPARNQGDRASWTTSIGTQRTPSLGPQAPGKQLKRFRRCLDPPADRTTPASQIATSQKSR